MSVDLINSINLNKRQNKITIRVTSSNVEPKTYESCEIFNNGVYGNLSFDMKMIFREISTAAITAGTLSIKFANK